METTLFENLVNLWRMHRRRFIKGFLMVLFANILLIANPLLFRHAVASASTPEGKNQQAILLWAALLISIAAISSSFKYFMRMELITISRDAEKDLRTKLFSRIQKQSQAFFDHNGTGELLSRLTNDITSYRDMIGPGITFPLFFITLMVPGIIALFSISTPLAFIALIPIIIIPLLNAAVRKQIYHFSLAVHKELGHMSNLSQEHYVGIRIIKSYVIENRLVKIFKKLCHHFASTALRLACLQGILFPLFSITTKIVTIMLVMVSGIIILGNWHQLTVGDFISFMWIQSYLFVPVVMMSWVLPIYERGRAAYARLVEIYQEPIQVKDNLESKLRIPAHADIVCTDLTFSYPNNSQPTLSRLNLTVKGGTTLGITGPVGAGKSTLLKLLNRDYEVADDMIFIGGHEIHEYPLKAFREAIVMVEQTSFLFSKTVAENVRFGKSDATQQEIEVVSQYAALHDDVMDFPLKYETIVGERGVTLSGGQIQRMAIARALLVNRSVLLLDDIFSAVDYATERHIFNAIKKHFFNKTVILVTQRVSILEKMDRIIYMVQGSIVEDGKPQELIAKGGYYAAFAELQKLAGEQSGN